MKNKRCPLQDECERSCQFEGRELECDYYYLNGVEGRGIADQERIREEREREEFRTAMDEQLEEMPDPDDAPDDEPSGVPEEPAAADTLATPAGEAAVTAPRELRDVTADIWAVRRQVARQALTGAIEVGRLLVEAKAMVPHGEWGTYIKEELDYSQSTANNLMKIFEEYGQSQQSLFGAGANSQALGNLTYTKALALLALPADEREEFAKSHDVEDMSARELQQAIKERDEEKAKVERARAERDAEYDRAERLEREVEDAKKAAEEAARAMDAARKELEELKARPVPVEKPDPATIDRLAEEKAAEAQKAHEKRVAELEKKLAAAETTAKEAEEALKNAQAGAADLKAKAEAAAQAEVDELKKKLAVAAPEVAAFQVHYDAVQREFSAMVEMVDKLTAAGHEKAPGLKAALQALAKWTAEVAG